MPSPFEGQVVKLAKRTHKRLTEVRDELARDKGRQVTYDEATEYLLDLREARAMIEVHASGVIARKGPAGEALD